MSVKRMAQMGCVLVALVALALGYWGLTAPAVVIVEWTTASELNTAGFNLYRSEAPEGPFTQVNEHLIPGSSDPLTGGSYVFTDTDVVAGRTYYYQLEDVEFSGATNRHGPLEVKAEGGQKPVALAAFALAGAAIVALIVLAMPRR